MFQDDTFCSSAPGTFKIRMQEVHTPEKKEAASWPTSTVSDCDTISVK